MDSSVDKVLKQIFNTGKKSSTEKLNNDIKDDLILIFVFWHFDVFQ